MGRGIRLLLLVLLLVLAACSDAEPEPIDDDATTTPTESVVDSVPVDGETTTTRLTPPGESWVDPEVLATGDEYLITWQGERGEIVVADLDPETGEVVEGSLRTVAEDGAALRETFNGPEFGLDADGWLVTYTRDGTEGHEIVVARPADDGFDLEVIAGDAPRFSPLPTRVADAESARVLFLEETGAGWGTAAWLDVAAPDEVQVLTELDRRSDADARWVVGEATLVTNGHPDHPGALTLVDTGDGVASPIADDGLDLTFPYGWGAPEADDTTAALAVVDGTELGLWSVSPDTGKWERWSASLTSPERDLPFLGSPEPFVAGGRSYVSLVTADEEDQRIGRTDQHVWLLSADGTTSVRCDDGADGPVTRIDPEVLVTDGGVFVYYYVLEDGGSTAYVCATSPVEDDVAEPGPTDEVELRSIPAEDTDAGLTTLNGDHVAAPPSGEERGRLLLFFPGTGAPPEWYSEFLTHASRLGFHAIGLDYDNLESVNFELCRGEDPAAGCHAAVRREILFGTESGWDPPDVTSRDSAMTRLDRLLLHLAQEFPDEGWEQYLAPTPENGPLWEAVTVAGHSQGGGHAGFVAMELEVERVILFGSTEPQPWTEGEPATPSDRWFGLVHRDERNATGIKMSWENLGLPGELVTMEDAAPDLDATHRLQSVHQTCTGDTADRGYFHNCPIADPFLPQGVHADHYDAAWTYLLTG